MKDRISRENKRALPKFLLVIFLGGIFGAAVTVFLHVASQMGITQQLGQSLSAAFMACIPYGIPVTSLLFLGVGFGIYRSCRRAFLSWDGEDESAMDAVEQRLSYAPLASTLALIADYFFFSAQVTYDYSLVLLAQFVVSLAAIVLLQQWVVDLERRMNPEKQGSVYDVHFHKKWMDSCDEAEQRQMGQAAAKALHAGTYACLFTWLALFLLNYIFDFGLVPLAAVLVIFGVLQVSYTLECIRLGRQS